MSTFCSIPLPSIQLLSRHALVPFEGYDPLGILVEASERKSYSHSFMHWTDHFYLALEVFTKLGPDGTPITTT